MSLLSAALLGLGLGVKHAVEADHLAAVCTLVARGGGVGRAARSGALWGAGHGAVIVLAGGALVLTGAHVPAGIATLLDAAVAVMLIGLGVASILGGRRALSDLHGHGHGHGHGIFARGGHAHDDKRGLFGAARPILVGIVHGASGTAALTLLVATTIPRRADALGFITLFGLASVLGMSVAAALFALPLRGVAQRAPSFAGGVRAVAGLASIAAGCFVAWGAMTGLSA